MKRTLVLLASLLLVYPSVAQQAIESPDPEEFPPDDDPRIYPEEIREPPKDWNATTWDLSAWHSGETGHGHGLESIDCGGRRECMATVDEAKQEEARQAEPEAEAK